MNFNFLTNRHGAHLKCPQRIYEKRSYNYKDISNFTHTITYAIK